jgi:hypothetical protein
MVFRVSGGLAEGSRIAVGRSVVKRHPMRREKSEMAGFIRVVAAGALE